ncbi:hypothetical protein Pst134EA_011791 [Puccinia striiformis f. sp. tritici]|uniref:hypothetical protein n=1 Tax=Puccinia striiformis f. sp. tritici TaxID=168172 RepID=UPI002008DB56|nr:hypothetical protein Pst134EA_011791 [Puccinia striiformis f. sp. tritici]KAH9468167.1 hypothetical protein Pst134EA_011791 [Puccinia striiformis f. sp. tritici]
MKTDLKEFAHQSDHINKGIKSFLNDMEQRLVHDREKIIKFHELEKAELKEEAARLKEEIERLRQQTLEDENQTQEDERELIELVQRQHAANLKRKMTQTESLVQSLAELKERKDRKRVKFTGLEKEMDEIALNSICN